MDEMTSPDKRFIPTVPPINEASYNTRYQMERTTASGLMVVETSKEPEPKIPANNRSTWEEVNVALIEMIEEKLPGCGSEEITISCMRHGPSPKQTVRWSQGGETMYKTLPCPGCNLKAWVEFLMEI